MQLKKIRWKVWGSVLLLAILLAATARIFGAFLAQHEKALDNEKALSALNKLRLRYAEVNSVHLVAKAKIAVYGEHFAVGFGSFEYWATGNQYRVKCRTDKNLNLNTDIDVAYNGERFQFLDQRSRTLSYRSIDDVRSHVALPNPLFLPVDYLSNDDDECRLCKLRLTDMKSESERWKRRAKDLGVRNKHQSINNIVVTDVEMPGGKVLGRPFKLRMRISGNERNELPSQIERLGPEGELLLSIEFDNFMDKGAVPVPRDILIRAFDEKGNVALRLEYTVTELEINQPIKDGAFTIAFDDADGVWDSDARKFVKQKQVQSPRR